MSQSGLSQWSGERQPACSVWLELQTAFRGVRIDSATENGSCQSVPHSGTAGDGGQGEGMPGGGYEDLGLVVCGDQDACRTWLIIVIKVNSRMTTFVSVVTSLSL